MFHKVAETIRNLRSHTKFNQKVKWMSRIIIITDFLKTEMKKKRLNWSRQLKNGKRVEKTDKNGFTLVICGYSFHIFPSCFCFSRFQRLKYDLVRNEYLVTTFEWEQIFNTFYMWLFVVIANDSNVMIIISA